MPHGPHANDTATDKSCNFLLISVSGGKHRSMPPLLSLVSSCSDIGSVFDAEHAGIPEAACNRGGWSVNAVMLSPRPTPSD